MDGVKGLDMTLCLTIWPIGQWRETLDVIRTVRPSAVMLHSDPDSLYRHAAKIADQLRRELMDGPVPEVWLGVAGDVGHKSAKARLAAGEPESKVRADLLALRMRAVSAAKRCGAARYMQDPEAAWKLGTPGFDAQAASEFVGAAKAELGPLPLLVTSYDCPTLHSTFPWRAWDACDAWAPQIYAAPMSGEPDPAATTGENRLALHHKHWARAEKLGWL
jgi:hypothetical protein